MSLNFESIARGSDIPRERQAQLLDTIQDVISSNWETTERHWSEQSSPFHDDYGLVFAKDQSKIIGYTIYRRLDIEGAPTLYRAGTAVESSYHGRGLHRRMSQAMFDTEKAADQQPMYFSWRTRNPVNWHANSRFLTNVTPSVEGVLEDPKMVRVCQQVAKALFPGCTLELPRMIMRDVYAHLKYYREPYEIYHSAPVARWFAETVSNSSDAILFVGQVR